MNVGELINELDQCNENATVSSILQEINETTFYETKVIRTEKEKENRINILVMDTNGKGITVNKLKSQIEQYNENLPVFVKEMPMNRPRRSFEILNIKRHKTIIMLEIPQRLTNLEY